MKRISFKTMGGGDFGWLNTRHHFSFAKEKLNLIASGKKIDENIKDIIFINQDVRVWGGKIKINDEIKIDITNMAYILNMKGEIEIKGEKGIMTLSERDGGEISSAGIITLISKSPDSKVLVFDVAKK